MRFNFFRRKKKPAESFDYFPSQRDLAGLDAIDKKNAVEAELAELKAFEELSGSQTQRKSELETELQQLLQSGQLQQALHTRSLTRESGSGEWTDSESEKRRILLVEDDRDLSELLCFCLERQQWDVTRISDGGEVLTWLETHPAVDVISLDLMLPHLDGLKLLQTLRADPRWQDIPILVASSKSDPETVQEVLQAGANAYLPKPIQPEIYLTKIQHLVS